MGDLDRKSSIGGSYQVSVHLAKQFQRRRFLEIGQSEANKTCLWRPCLLTDWNKICNVHRGPAIDASCKVLVHLVKGLQRG